MGLEYWGIKHYTNANILKVKYRGEHFCYRCNSILSITKHEKIVSQKSEEAKYYDFSYYSKFRRGHMFGPCKFIHDVFYCPKCFKYIEFITQLNFEDLNILMHKIKKYFSKKGRNILIKKCYETKEGKLIDRIDQLENIQNGCLVFFEDNRMILDYRFPLLREKFYERPYYFEFSKKQIMTILKIKLNDKNK